jgi:peptidoglycan/xylan/chitin deacetylase (PgdA/CDA1 family)
MSKLPIFMYHHVSDSLYGASKSTLISPDNFERQMSYLFKKGFHCLTLSETVSNFQAGKPQPERSFVLTLDDGYVDNYEWAYPILKKFGFSATIFLVVKPVEERNSHYLSWREIRELSQNNFTFGSHTLTHSRLSRLDEAAIQRELLESKKVIEDRVGLPVDLLAYPYGDSDDRVQDLACKNGYQAACGVDEGTLTLFNLWRVPINEDENDLTFYWKTCGGFHTYTWFREHTYIGKKLRVFRRSSRKLWTKHENR